MRVAPRFRRGPEILRRRRSQAHRSAPGVRPILQELEARFLLSGTDAFQPSAAEQYMLEVINHARANPAAEGQRLLAIAQSDPLIAAATRNTNPNQFLQIISGYGPEPPLAFNTRLIEAARYHNAAMLGANNQFHSPPGYLNNSGVATAADAQVYYPTGNNAWATGENIFAYSSNLPAASTDPTYVDYFNAAFFLDWGNPDFGHLKNLLAPGPAEASPGINPFREIGIGVLTAVTPTAPPSQNNPIAGNRGLNVGPDLVTQEFGWSPGNAFLTGVVYADNDHNSFYSPGEGAGSVTIQAVGRAGQGTFQTQTWDSGGYSLSLPPGSYDVQASGGILSSPQATSITIGLDNLPWNIQLAAQAGSSSSGAGGSGNNPGVTPPAAAPFADQHGTPGVVTSQGAHHIKKARHQIHPHGPLALSRPTHARSKHAITADIILGPTGASRALARHAANRGQRSGSR